MIKNFRNLYLFTLICTTNLFAGINSTVSITGVASSTDVSGITSEINNQYQSSAQSQVVDFLNAMAAAQAMVNAGMGQDYSSNKSLFVIGGGANLGFNPGNNSLSNLKEALDNAKGLPALGLGAQIGGFVGISLGAFPVPTLGPIDLKRMTVFINYSGYNLDQVKPYTIKTSSFGIHAQYNAIQPVSKAFGILNWGGLNFGTGFDVSNNAFSASGSLTEAKYGSLN